MKIKQIITVSSIIFLFLLFNIFLFDKGGFPGDISSQQHWGNTALQQGLSILYSKGITDYPPLYMYVLKFNAWLNSKLSGKLSYTFISKTIPTLCNLIIGLVVFFYLRKKNYKIALIAMCLYLFNPVIMYNTAYWGQIDSANTLFMFLSIIFLIHKKYIPSTIFIVLAVLTKIQSIVLVPIIGIVLLMNSNVKKIVQILFIDVATIFIVLLPYILGGTFWKIIKVIFDSVDRYPLVTANTYNIWFLVSPRTPSVFWTTLRDSTQIFGISLKIIGLSLLAIYTLIVIYQLIKKHDANNIILGAASMAFAFFMLPTQIHERYLFPFFALFVLIALNNRKYLWIYVILSVTSLFNLMMVFPFYSKHIIFYPIQILLSLMMRFFSFINLAILISLVNILVFIYFSKIGIFHNLLRNIRKDLHSLKTRIKNV
jgi:Gpi18-like mannosyltransferase